MLPRGKRRADSSSGHNYDHSRVASCETDQAHAERRTAAGHGSRWRLARLGRPERRQRVDPAVTGIAIARALVMTSEHQRPCGAPSRTSRSLGAHLQDARQKLGEARESTEPFKVRGPRLAPGPSREKAALKLSGMTSDYHWA
jgi:hypothetical protein